MRRELKELERLLQASGLEKPMILTKRIDSYLPESHFYRKPLLFTLQIGHF